MSTRVEAANLLRAIRAVGVVRAGDLLDWALAIMPDSLQVQRLHIAALLQAGDVSAAESAAARALLVRPTHASLILLRASCLMAREQWFHADAELTRAIHLRPHHRHARELAAQVANHRRDYQRALALLEPLCGSPTDRMRAIMVEALLGCGDVERAEWVLDAMQSVPATLKASVLRAQGRVLDAADTLERAAACANGLDDDALTMLLEVLEELGDTARLARALKLVNSSCPRAQMHLGRIRLRQGRFADAVVAAASLVRNARFQHEALPTLVVAASMLGRSRLARRALGRLQRTTRGVNARIMAERWQRGMLGKLVRSQDHARQAGCDPSSSVLQALLADAVGCERAPMKSRRIKDSAGGGTQLSERSSEQRSVLATSPVLRPCP